jgi:hypothetical protein
MDDADPLMEEIRRQEENMLQFPGTEMFLRYGITSVDSVGGKNQEGRRG